MDYQEEMELAGNAVAHRFAAANPNSKARYEAARAFLPGGNSRFVLHYDPFPVRIERGEGALLTDIDGHQYVDFANDFTAGLFGHSHPTLRSAIQEALDGGMHLGGPNVYEDRFAEAMCTRFESVERVRFCNSGTEANLLALQLALAVTKRSRVLVFDGSYHGSVLNFVGGPGALNVGYQALIGVYNDPEHLRDLVNQNGDDLAAVIVEPMLGSGGCIMGDCEFLQSVRDEATRCGAILIFDEVQTSRLFPGGLQKKLGIRPDLTTFGKHLGGGLAFGAFGGKSEVMSRLDPSGPAPIVHGGTFNNNVFAMAAGLAAITQILNDSVMVALNERGERLRRLLIDLGRKVGVFIQATGEGSILGIHFQEAVPRRPSELCTPWAWRKVLHLEMLLRGFYIARRGLICLSLPTEESHCVDLLGELEQVLLTYRAITGRLR